LTTFLPNKTILHFCIFRYWRSVATHLRCYRIFIDSTINTFSPDSDSETSLKIGQYLTKLRRTKQCASFLGHPVELTPIGTTSCGSSRI